MKRLVITACFCVACLGQKSTQAEDARAAMDPRALALENAYQCELSGRKAAAEKRFADAERSYRCAVELREPHLSPDDSRLNDVRINWASMLRFACREVEARSQLALVLQSLRGVPTAADLSAEAQLELAYLHHMHGRVEAAHQVLLELGTICQGPMSAPCFDAYWHLAEHARLHIGDLPPEAALAQPPAPNAYAKQFNVLLRHAWLLASSQVERAADFAKQHAIVTLAGNAPWPKGPLEPPGNLCRGVRTQQDMAAEFTTWRSALETIDDCIESTPVPNPHQPPVLVVALLSNADGSTAAVEANGIALPDGVLECAVQASELLRIPAMDRGFVVNYLLYRPG